MSAKARLALRRRPLAALGLIAVAVTAIGVWLTDQHSQPSVSATPRRGWILHEKYETTVVPRAGAGRFEHQQTERWQLNSDSCATRAIQRVFFWTPPVETAQSSNPSTGWAYSRRNNTLYWRRPGNCTPFDDPAADIKQRYESGSLKLKARVKVDGRPALRLEDKRGTQTIMVVDAKTFVPLLVRFPGVPLKQRGSTSVCSYETSRQFPETTGTRRTVAFEYLPPTKANLNLLDIRAQHPDARIAPAKEMPQDFRKSVSPPSCGNSGRP